MIFQLQIKEKLNITNVLNKKSEIEIFQYIFTNFKRLDCNFSARDEDIPSAVVREYRGRLYFKDFGDATQPHAETWIQYLIRINGWEDNTKGYYLALNWANDTFNLGLEGVNTYTIKSALYSPKNTKITMIEPKSYEEKKTKIEVRRREWNNDDLTYWKQYAIPLKKLEEKGIAPLKQFWVTNFKKGGIRLQYNCDNTLSYVYPYYRGEHGEFMYKIYQPLLKVNKWISNVDRTIIQNKEFIPKSGGNLLISQSSWKDIMVMELMGLYSIAPNTEADWYPEEWWNKTYPKWDNVIIFGNNDFHKKDNPGLKYGMHHSVKYSLPLIHTPSGTTSDISDYIKVFGFNKAQILTERLINDALK